MDEDNETPRQLIRNFLEGPTADSETPYPPVVQTKKEKMESRAFMRRKSSVGGATPRTLLKEVLQEKVNRNSSVFDVSQFIQKNVLKPRQSKSKTRISNVLSSESSDLELSDEENDLGIVSDLKKKPIKITRRERNIPGRESLERELKLTTTTTESEASDFNAASRNTSIADYENQVSKKVVKESLLKSAPKSTDASHQHISQTGKLLSVRKKLIASSESNITDDEESSSEHEKQTSHVTKSVSKGDRSIAIQKAGLNTTFQKETPSKKRAAESLFDEEPDEGNHSFESDIQKTPEPVGTGAEISGRKTSVKKSAIASVPGKSMIPRIQDLRRESRGSIGSGSFKSLSSMTEDELESEENVQQVSQANSRNQVPEQSKNTVSVKKSRQISQLQERSVSAVKSPVPLFRKASSSKFDYNVSQRSIPLTGHEEQAHVSRRGVTGNISFDEHQDDQLSNQTSEAIENSESTAEVDEEEEETSTHEKSNKMTRQVGSAPASVKQNFPSVRDNIHETSRRRSSRFKRIVSYAENFNEEEDMDEEPDSPEPILRKRKSSKRSTQMQSESSGDDQTSSGHSTSTTAKNIHSKKLRYEASKAAVSSIYDVDPKQSSNSKHGKLASSSVSRSRRSNIYDAMDDHVEYDDERNGNDIPAKKHESPSKSQRLKSLESHKLDVSMKSIENVSRKSGHLRSLKDPTPSVRASFSSNAQNSHSLNEVTQPFDKSVKGESNTSDSIADESGSESLRNSFREKLDQATEPLPEKDDDDEEEANETQVSRATHRRGHILDSRQTAQHSKQQLRDSPEPSPDPSSVSSPESEILPLSERISRRLTHTREDGRTHDLKRISHGQERSSVNKAATVVHSKNSLRNSSRIETSLPASPSVRKDRTASRIETTPGRIHTTPRHGSVSVRKESDVEMYTNEKSRTSTKSQSVAGGISQSKKPKIHSSSPIPKDYSRNHSAVSFGISPIKETEEPGSSPQSLERIKSSIRSKSQTPVEAVMRTLRSMSKVSPQPGPSGWHQEDQEEVSSDESVSPKSSQQRGKKARQVPHASIPASLTRQIIQHFSGFPVLPSCDPILDECINAFWEKTLTTLSAYAEHAGRDTIEKADVELYLYRLGLAKDRNSINALIEKHLPFEMRCEVLPMAIAGNKIV